MHGSELDAAWHDIKPYLPPTLRAEYATQTDVDKKYARRNSGAASMGEADGGDEDGVMPTSKLYELAMLITGKWGALALPKVDDRRSWPSAKAFEPQKTKGVFSDTSYKPSQYMGFWQRMSELSGLLASRIKAANAVYDRKRSTGRRSWVISMERMKSAVDFILKQKMLPASERSIFAVNDGGVMRPMRSRDGRDVPKIPLGVRLSVLMADGNSKLPFIAYSELPMATCPGAGECGVQMKDASTGSVVGWCYSFKAWRYPDAFTRQFLNSLANYADREFWILQHNGDDDSDGPGMYWPRVEASMKGGGFRPWMQYVASLALREAAEIIYADVAKNARMTNEENGGRVVFLRLFVDGDIGQPDSIHSWMQAINMLSDASARSSAASVIGTKKEPMNSRWFGPMQVYGYSKCWGEFVALDQKFGGYKWPENYTLNLSSGSLYAKNKPVAEAINALPIARGGFNAIDFRQHLQSLKGIKPESIVMPKTPPLPGVTQQQLRGIVAIEGIKYGRVSETDPVTKETIIKLDEAAMISSMQKILKTYFNVDPSEYTARRGLTLKKPEELPSQSKARVNAIRARNEMIDAYAGESELEMRKKTLIIALNKMMSDPSLSSVLKREIARDNGYRDAASFREALDEEWERAKDNHANRLKEYRSARRRGEDVTAPSEPKRKPIPYEPVPAKGGAVKMTERQEKKLIALLVHAIFVASRTSASGSCPLVCGNCADITVGEASDVWKNDRSFKDFQAKTGAVHRCASRVPTEGYVPPPGKRLPKGVEVDPKTGMTKPYKRRSDGKIALVTGYYGAEIHIGLH